MSLSKRSLKEQSGRIFEAKKDEKGRISFPVVIISQGLGNLADKNYYTAEAIQSAPSVYEGKKAYYDHPTQTQNQEQPGRSVKEIVGHYENCKVVKSKEGLLELHADLVPIQSKEGVIGLIEHSIDYKKKYPDGEFIGVSINGDGEGKAMDYDEFIKEYKPTTLEMEKLNQVAGQQINAITKLTAAVSADLVTEAGAKGRFLTESKYGLKKRRTKMFEAMRKFLRGAELNDKKMIEAAAKDMLQNESEDEAKKEAAEDEAMSKEAECLAKAMLQAKKEMEKKEDESEAAYEARCMKQAMMQMKKEKKAEDEKAEKAEGEKKEEFPPKKDDKKDDADGDEKDEKAEDEKAEAAKDDEKHDDADQDKALIKKMMKQMDEMKKEIESMKGEKKESEDEAKKHHESAVKANIEIEATKRTLEIDRELGASGLPRYATEKLKELFMTKVKSKEERKKMIDTAKEVHSKAIESAFYGVQSTGFTEIAPGKDETSTDHLF